MLLPKSHFSLMSLEENNSFCVVIGSAFYSSLMKRPFVKLSYWKNNIFFVVLPALRNNLTLVFAELIQSLLLPAPWVFAKISSLSYYIYKTYSSVNTDSHEDKTNLTAQLKGTAWKIIKYLFQIPHLNCSNQPELFYINTI